MKQITLWHWMLRTITVLKQMTLWHWLLPSIILVRSDTVWRESKLCWICMYMYILLLLQQYRFNRHDKKRWKLTREICEIISRIIKWYIYFQWMYATKYYTVNQCIFDCSNSPVTWWIYIAGFEKEEFEHTKGAKTNDALTLYPRYNRTGNKDSNTHTITTEVKINKFNALILCNKDSNAHSITTEMKINKFKL